MVVFFFPLRTFVTAFEQGWGRDPLSPGGIREDVVNLFKRKLSDANTKQFSDPCLFSVAVMLIPSLVAWLQGAWHVNSSALFVPEMWWTFVGARQQIVS